jgi:hypothetical protein
VYIFFVAMCFEAKDGMVVLQGSEAHPLSWNLEGPLFEITLMGGHVTYAAKFGNDGVRIGLRGGVVVSLEAKGLYTIVQEMQTSDERGWGMADAGSDFGDDDVPPDDGKPTECKQQ